MNLFKSLMKLSLIITLTKTVSFIKDIVVAKIFGASEHTDYFFISIKITNFLRRILSEGAFFQIFIPLLIEYKKNKNNKFIKDFISCTLGLIILFLTLLTLLLMIISPFILKLFILNSKDYNTNFNLANKILRIILLHIIISTLSSLSSSILNTWNNFMVPLLSMLILSIVTIILSIFSRYISIIPILILSWSIVIGNLFQFLYQLKYLNNINMIVLPKINFNNEGLIILINKMGYSLLSSFINQMSLISNSFFTSSLISGSISWMYYADKIVEFPSGILSNTLNTLLFPHLSKNVIDNNKVEYSKSLDWCLKLTILLSLPITMGLIILSKPIIFSLFQYGKFSFYDVSMTQKSLISYSIGFTGLILVKILTSSFYSYKDIITPFKVSLITFLFTQISNYILINNFKYIGLSLSISVTYFLNSFLLFYFLLKKKLFKLQTGWNKFLLITIISTLFMSLILLILIKYISNWNVNLFIRLIKLLFLIFIGILSYLISLFSLGFKLSFFNYKF